ncbi:MAG TPA: serine/threonine-protein kinase, partial [Phycisphaerae bacterium]|nr:serine/threonine-protein kinase [Phycisphaerae bacterium]
MAPRCPELSELEMFVDGALEGVSRDEVARHASSCAACNGLVSELKENLDVVEPVRRVLSRMKGEDAPADAAPESVGQYRVIREIGRGGMGVVYEAQQPTPHRRVAVKVLHPGFGGEARVQRMFRQEAEVLGRLKHAGIAAIYESGRTGDGRSFFAMELVAGQPLTAYARNRNLALPERLTLFRRVCDAVAYAHQRGVIHRDLKPSNILITESGEPKVLDFGLARILHTEGADAHVTAITEEGRVQGTLPYMSPEQVRGEFLEIDVRSDVYSLGVVLHELLSGTLPYPIDRARLAMAAQTICEQPPTRLSTLDRSLRGDVETIVLKALEKDPERRYANVSALADDIGRHLSDQPIQARPPTLTYQFGKLIRRHKAPAALVATMLLLVIGFGVAMSVLYSEARENLERAESAEQTAETEAGRARRDAAVATRIKDYLLEVFRVSDPEISVGETITARQLLDRGAERLAEQLNDEPAVQAALMHTIGCVYENLGLYEPAANLLAKALEKRQALDPDSTEVAESAAALGDAFRRQNKLDGAALSYKVALDIMRRRGGDASGLHVTLLLQGLAEVQQERGDLHGAETAFGELVDELRRSPHGAMGLPAMLNSYAGVLAINGEFKKAVPLMKEAIALLDEKGYGGRTTRLRLEGNLAWLLARSGQDDEAEPLIRAVLAERRKVLPARHPELATSLITLGVVHLNRKKAMAAEPLFREAVSIRDEIFGKDQADSAEAQAFLGQCLTRLGQFEEAERLLIDSYETLQASARAGSIDLVEAAGRLIEHYEAREDPEQAGRWREEV